MTQLQTINLGSYPNDGTGDDLRTAFTKVNTNFNTLFTEGAIVNGTNLGSGTSIFADKNNTNLNLEFKTLTSDPTIVITHDNNTVRLSSVTKLQYDAQPTLGANLNLNQHSIYGGDTQTSIYGLDFPVLNNLVSAVLASNQLNLDLGTLLQPTGYQHYSKGYPIDLNGTGVLNGFNNALQNDYDFGPLVANNVLNVGTSKITLNSNLTTNGGSITLNALGNTSVTLPSSGSLATINSGLDQFSGTTSSRFRTVISDATGSGLLVFNSSPYFTGTISTSNISASGYAFISGDLAVNGNKFEVNSVTGDVFVSGKITVNQQIILETNGSAFLSGSIDTLGSLRVNVSKFTVDATTGNTNVAGNLTVDGIITGQNTVTVAKLLGNQTITSGSDIPIQLEIISGNVLWWVNDTYRFKPSVAGHYNISYLINWGVGTGAGQINVQIHLNGNSISINQSQVNINTNYTMSASLPVYLNGTTDYVYLTAYSSSDTNQAIQSGIGTVFSAFLISK